MALLREPTQAQVAARPRRYKIVVGIDLSEYADIVIEHALDQAARHDAPELHFLTVCEKRNGSVDDCKQALWERVTPQLETFSAFGANWRARIHARRGKPELEIAELAAEIRADLIVIGQFGLHNKSGDKTVPNRVLQHATCPTLVVGLPEPVDASPICPSCAAVREDSDGERWFCAQHGADAGADHVMTPMTTWTGGSLMW